MTSHDVVGLLRRRLGERRIGHSGTLDPDATGVLLCGVGNLTRFLRYLTDLPKTYTAEVVLGATTNTLDDSGEILETFDMSGVTLDAALIDKIKQQIRANTTPRHVPAKVLQVSDIPRTKSNKIVELAVRNVVHGRPVRNLEVLANPDALEEYRDRDELRS